MIPNISFEKDAHFATLHSHLSSYPLCATWLKGYRITKNGDKTMQETITSKIVQPDEPVTLSEC